VFVVEIFSGANAGREAIVAITRRAGAVATSAHGVDEHLRTPEEIP
jgi:hypothetical protein